MRRTSIESNQMLKQQTNPSGTNRPVDNTRHLRSSPGLPRPGVMLQSPREQMSSPMVTRGRTSQKAPNTSSVNPRGARSQTRDQGMRGAQLRGTSQQPPQNRNPKQHPVSISSKLREDVLAAFGVKLNGVVKASPKNTKRTNYNYEDIESRKHSLDSNSSGISGCSQDSLNGCSNSGSPVYADSHETVMPGMGYSPHSHLHSQDDGISDNTSSVISVHEPSIRVDDYMTRSYDENVDPMQNNNRKLNTDSTASIYGDYGSISSRSSTSNNSTKSYLGNSNNKKHKSRVHVGGSSDTLPVDVQRNNNINNNNYSCGSKPYKATTISINMGPVMQDSPSLSKKYSKHSPSSSRQTNSHSSSRSSRHSPATSKHCSPSPPPNKNNLGRPQPSPYNSRRAAVPSSLPNPRQNPTCPSHNSSSGRSSTVSNASSLSSTPRSLSSRFNGSNSAKSSVRSTKKPSVSSHITPVSELSTTQSRSVNKSSISSSNIRKQSSSRKDGSGCSLSRSDNKPVSRLVRKGTFRIADNTLGADGVEIIPSIRLRYLMQRASSNTTDETNASSSSVPSSPDSLRQQKVS